MTRTDPTAAAGSAAAEERAAEWLARLQAEDCSSEDWRRFCDWRDADSGNEAVFARYAQEWSALSELGEDSEIVKMRLVALALERDTASRPWLMSAAAGIVLFLAVGLAALSFWPEWNAEPGEPQIAVADQTGVDIAYGQSVQRELGPDRFVQSYRSAIGQRSKIDLPDGSTIELNTDTVVEVAYTPQRREFRLLRGEALFDVERDPSRPFVVNADDDRVIALGTVFSVLKRSGEVVVSLIEGEIQVDRMADADRNAGRPVRSARLEAGQQLVSTNEREGFQVSALDRDRALGWRTGRLVFDGDRLGDVVEDLNRYTVRKLSIGDPALADMRVSGTFRTGSAEVFAKALVVVLPVTTSVDPANGSIVLQAAPGNP